MLWYSSEVSGDQTDQSKIITQQKYMDRLKASLPQSFLYLYALPFTDVLDQVMNPHNICQKNVPNVCSCLRGYGKSCQ